MNGSKSKFKSNRTNLKSNNLDIDENNLDIDENNLDIDENNLDIDENNLKSNNLDIDENNLKSNNLDIDENNLKSNNLDIDEKCDKRGVNIFLANLVFVFHTIVILFVLTAPFSNIPALLILHITFSISLILHWLFNSNECSLTYIEAKLRGLDKTQSFTHQFVAPMYEISTTEWSKICYIITIVLLCVSMYYLYNSERVSKAFGLYSSLSNNPDYLTKSFYEKSFITFNCFKDLLVWQ